ncbi:interleukin 19 like [Amia ocellicauda]|uniref:interleukin 19 like n=1 Tax=Amia ocellicauda TaxID=2972642 RepID=UPI003463EB89
MAATVNVSCLLSAALMAVSVLLSLSVPPAAGHHVRLGSCSVTVHTKELREYFHEIRHAIVKEDDNMGIRLLKENTMKNVQASESCCFLRQLLRFYVESVFSQYSTSSPQVRRRTSNLANSFLSIKRDLRQCHAHMHCHCEEETRLKVEAIQTTFNKLNVKAAAVKAIGELDFLLDWLENFRHN